MRLPAAAAGRVVSNREPIYDRMVHGLEDRFRREAQALAEHLPHRHATASAAPAATSATMTTATPEVHVSSLLAEIKTDIKTLAAKAEALDETAASKLESISGNPQAMGVFNDLATLAGVPGLPGEVLGTAGVFLKALVDVHNPAPAEAAPVPAEPLPADVPQAAPAGPVASGVA